MTPVVLVSFLIPSRSPVTFGNYSVYHTSARFNRWNGGQTCLYGIRIVKPDTVSCLTAVHRCKICSMAHRHLCIRSPFSCGRVFIIQPVFTGKLIASFFNPQIQRIAVSYCPRYLLSPVRTVEFIKPFKLHSGGSQSSIS